jgi:hypothetical protein
MDIISSSLLDRCFGASISLVWCFDKNSAGKDICSNPITHLRPQDYICLKKNEKSIETWNWAQEIFNYSEGQVIFYSEPIDDAEKKACLNEIFQRIKNLKCAFIPFKIDKVLLEEAEKEGVVVLSDNIYELPDKRWIHPALPESDQDTHYINGKRLPKGVNLLPGFSCFSHEDLKNAREILKRRGITKTVIKNTFSSAGNNIFFIESDEDFESALEKIVFKKLIQRNQESCYLIEEMTDFKINEYGECMTPIVHGVGTYVIPDVLHQIVKGSKYLGASSLKAEPNIAEKCLEQANLISEALNLKGTWGIDFVLDANKIPYPIDINIGRMCGSHYFRFFIDLYAKDMEFASFKIGDFTFKLEELQKKLTQNKMNFDMTTKKGMMFFRVADEGNLTALFMGDEDEIDKMRKKLVEITEHSLHH